MAATPEIEATVTAYKVLAKAFVKAVPGSESAHIFYMGLVAILEEAIKAETIDALVEAIKE